MTAQEERVEALAKVIEKGWGNPTWDGETLRPIDRVLARAVLDAGYEPANEAREAVRDLALENVDRLILGSSGFADAVRDAVRACIAEAS